MRGSARAGRHTGRRWRRAGGWPLSAAALLLVVAFGCVHLPADVAAELAPADASRPNHFELRGPPEDASDSR